MPKQSAVKRAPGKRAASEAEALAVIAKGGEAASEEAEKALSLRLRMTVPGLLRRIDRACKLEPVKPSRNQWIMRALVAACDKAEAA